MSSFKDKLSNLARKSKVSAISRVLRARLRSWQGWRQEGLSLALLFITLEIAVLSIERAAWIRPQPLLTLVLFLAILTGTLLVKNRWRSALKYAIVIILGAVIIVWQSAAILPSAAFPGQNQVAAALQFWWRAVTAARPSESTVHFAIFLIAITWIAGYISAWFLLRKRNAWIGLCLGALMIIVNLSNLNAGQYSFLFFYFIAAALLLGQFNWERRFHWLDKEGIGKIRRSVLYFLASLLCLSILASSVAWYTPQIHIKGLENLVSANIPRGKNIDEYWANIFAAVPRKQSFLKSTEQDELQFKRYFDIGQEVQFTIHTEQPRYWRVRAYDIYTSGDWTNSPVTENVLPQGTSTPAGRDFSEDGEITYTVKPDINSDILLVAGEFIAADNLGVSRMEVGESDTVSVITLRPLRPDESYEVTAGIRPYTYRELSSAGANYPNWVMDYYLQLPTTLPSRVKRLSEELTKEAKSPYEKALAINSYLSRFTYTLDVNEPPEGADVVDHFLFDLKTGNCAYFASAMTVMLRSVGVPARFVIGYLPGEWDENSGTATVRAKHFHAWPEIYFPGYGWIEAEKLPAPVVTSDSGVTGSSDSGYVGYIEEDWLAWWDVPGSYTSSRSQPGPQIIFPGWFYPTVFAVIIAAIIVLSALWIIRSSFYRWLWGRRGAGTIFEIYARICFLAGLIGLGPQPYQTPFEYSARLGTAFPHQADSINYIVRIYLQSQFGNKKNIELDNDVRLLKSRTQVYYFLLRQAGPLKYLFRRR